MKKTFLSTVAVLAMAMTFTDQAQAQVQDVSLGYSGWYYSGNQLVHSFGRPTFVERMTITAEGSSSFASADVYADGEWVAHLGVPGSDPVYPVPVRKTVSTIMINFSGTIRIKDIRVSVAPAPTPRQNPVVGDLTTPQGLGETTMQVVSQLQMSINPADFQTYMMPIRKAALLLAAAGGGRPLLSGNTEQRAQALVTAITAAESFLEDNLGAVVVHQECIRTLLFVRERIQAIYELH